MKSILSLLFCSAIAHCQEQPLKVEVKSASIELFDFQEITIKQKLPKDVNPFTQVSATAEFVNGTNSSTVTGFYDSPDGLVQFPRLMRSIVMKGIIQCGVVAPLQPRKRISAKA